MTGWPAASRLAASASRPPSVPPAERDPDEGPVRPVGLDRAERLQVDRHDPDAVLAGALRDELLRPTPRRLAISSSARNVSLSRPPLASVADGEAERQPRVGRRVRVAAGAEHR